jgi:hypothetical protein
VVVKNFEGRIAEDLAIRFVTQHICRHSPAEAGISRGRRNHNMYRISDPYGMCMIHTVVTNIKTCYHARIINTGKSVSL